MEVIDWSWPPLMFCTWMTGPGVDVVGSVARVGRDV